MVVSKKKCNFAADLVKEQKYYFRMHDVIFLAPKADIPQYLCFSNFGGGICMQELLVNDKICRCKR